MIIQAETTKPRAAEDVRAEDLPPPKIYRVLIVDDEAPARKVLALMLAQTPFSCTLASSGDQALRILATERHDAVISDLQMAGLSGMDLLREVRQCYPHIAFLVTTGVDEIRIGVQAMQRGAEDYLVKPFDMDVVVASLHSALQKKRLEREVENYKRHLEEMVSLRTVELQAALRKTERSYKDTLEALGAAIDLRDSPTAGHSQRVFLYSMEIARIIGCAEYPLGTIAMGARLHDIGKLAIPDRILLKPGPLSADEWDIMRQHSRIGYDLVKSISFLADAAEIVLTHHERHDGSGYPQGLAAEHIPLGARIFAVADTVDAMTSDRPYRAALPFESARSEIERGSGTLYDPQVVGAFLQTPNEAWAAIREETVAVRANSVLAAGIREVAEPQP